MRCKCPFDLYLIIAHELQRQECTFLMTQQQILALIPNRLRSRADLTPSWYKRPSCGCWVKSGLQWEEIFLSLTGHAEWAAGHDNSVVGPMWLSEREDEAATMWSGCLILAEHQHTETSDCSLTLGFMVINEVMMSRAKRVSLHKQKMRFISIATDMNKSKFSSD